jgi:hypothetical protein
MAGPPNCLCIDKLEECDLIEELTMTPVLKELDGSQMSSEDGQERDSYVELEWRSKVPTDKVCAHTFVGEQMG